MFRWVAGVGAGSREEIVARRCGVDKLGRCCGATNPCLSKCDDVGFVAVGQVVECSNMFRGEHGPSVEGADEEVCRVGGPAMDLHDMSNVILNESAAA